MAVHELTHLFLWTLFLCCHQQATAECPDGWFNADYLGCYYFDVEYPDRNLSWVEAMDVCDKMGGYLAEIQTEEQAELVASIAMVEESLTGVGSWWIGLTDMGHEGRWMWSHSSANSSYSDWLPGHPNTAPHNMDDCAYISESDLFLWRDVPCYQGVRAAPICQRDLDFNPTTTTEASTTRYPTTTTRYPTTTTRYPGSTTRYPTTTTRYPASTTHNWHTTTHDYYYVELRGGNAGGESGNVYAVNRNGYLGPVCDDGWTDTNAAVVCRQLGYSYGTRKTGSYFGQVPSNFAMDEVRCKGDEAFLQDCSYDTSEDCGASEGAGVFCYYGTTTYWPWTTTGGWWTTTTTWN